MFCYETWDTKKELQDPGDGLRVQAPVAFHPACAGLHAQGAARFSPQTRALPPFGELRATFVKPFGGNFSFATHHCSTEYPAPAYSPPKGVPSALTGLTSVFGMGTGVTPSPWSPRKPSVRVTCMC